MSDRETHIAAGEAGDPGARSTAPATATGLARRRRWLVTVAAGSVLLAGAGGAASLMIKSPAQAASEADAPPLDVLTAAVERRVLQETVILRGTVTSGQSVQVSPSVSGSEGQGTPVVTKLAVSTRSTVAAGNVLLEVSGRPVFVLKGKLPVYRDLKPGSAGDDVAQLQKTLNALGHGTGIDRAGTFGEGTKAALKTFYASIGYDPLPAQADGGEAVKTAKESVTSAERALEDAKDARQDALNEAGTGKGSTSKQAQKTVERAAEDVTAARQALAEAQAADGPMLPAGEVVYLEGFPARVDAVTAAVGSEVSGPVMKVSAGALVVQGYLQEHQKGMVRPGQKVQILSEVSGVTAKGTVLSVADTMEAEPAQSGADGEDGPDQTSAGSQGYAMLVRPDKALRSELAGQDVRLTVEAASTDGKALVVPVTAISAGADGKTTVTVVGRTGAQRRVEVLPGTAGDGFVEVVPVGPGKLAEGDDVVTGIDAETGK